MFRKLAVTFAAAAVLGCAGLASDSTTAAPVWRPHGGGGGGFHNFGGGGFRNFGHGGFAHFGGVRHFAYHAPFQHFAYHAPLQRYGIGRHAVTAYAPHGVTTAAASGSTWQRDEGRDHRHGWFAGRDFRRGYVGWNGSEFWPYAYDDLFGYAFYPYDDAFDGDLFWDYGYDDLFAGVLLPYAYGGPGNGVGAPPVASTAGPSPSAPASASSPAQACASAQSIAGGAAIDAIANAVHPTADQSAKLDALKTAEANAEKTLAASCATAVPATAEARLDAVESRLQAMVQAADAVRGPLGDFYSSLSDEQKAAFNALGENGKSPTPRAVGSLAQLCGPDNAVPVVATDQIVKAVQPDAKQQASLAALNDAANKADQAILASCPSQAPLTPPARLDAVKTRLQAMLNGVDLVKPALHDFYASLSDAQKARFDALTMPPSSAQPGATTQL